MEVTENQVGRGEVMTGLGGGGPRVQRLRSGDKGSVLITPEPPPKDHLHEGLGAVAGLPAVDTIWPEFQLHRAGRLGKGFSCPIHKNRESTQQEPTEEQVGGAGEQFKH